MYTPLQKKTPLKTDSFFEFSNNTNNELEYIIKVGLGSSPEMLQIGQNQLEVRKGAWGRNNGFTGVWPAAVRVGLNNSKP